MSSTGPITLMPHEDIKGKFMVVARVTAVPGREDDLLRLLKDVQRESEAEVGCLTYRPTRGVGEQAGQYTIIEEYVSRDALALHRTGKAYLDLRGSGAVGETEVKFWEEL